MLLKPDDFGRLCRARDLLAESGEPSLSIREIAARVRISPFHFIRLFEALFGLTPHQFRIRTRLDRARVLLTKDYSVTDVCMEVGFSSLGSFSSLFASRIGTTPSQFQRRARVLVSVPGLLTREVFPGCFSLMARLPRSAFSQFSRSIQAAPLLECGEYANQAHQPDGR